MSQLGQHVNTTQLNKFLEHIFNRNNKLNEKGQRGNPRCPFGASAGCVYLAAVLPNRLRNRSTRPPMLSTDFCVPV